MTEIKLHTAIIDVKELTYSTNYWWISLIAINYKGFDMKKKNSGDGTNRGRIQAVRTIVVGGSCYVTREMRRLI